MSDSSEVVDRCGLGVDILEVSFEDIEESFVGSEIDLVVCWIESRRDELFLPCQRGSFHESKNERDLLFIGSIDASVYLEIEPDVLKERGEVRWFSVESFGVGDP